MTALALVAAAAQPAFAVPAPLTPQDQSQVTALVGKLLELEKNLPADSTQGTYEGAFSDAMSGYSGPVIEAALKQLAGTPGLTQAAKLAAKKLQDQVAQNGATGAGTGAIGGLGGPASSFGGPGFAGGGGGSGYTGK